MHGRIYTALTENSRGMHFRAQRLKVNRSKNYVLSFNLFKERPITPNCFHIFGFLAVTQNVKNDQILRENRQVQGPWRLVNLIRIECGVCV